jgi:hypothetical protein
MIELEDSPRWRVIVLDWDQDNKFYVPDHYDDIWGTQSDAHARLIQMLLASGDAPSCNCALCTDALEWGLRRRST